MECSPARLAANRANALKSSGPKTAEGKERSRCNAIKHGMTGEGIALSSEDAEAIEARFLGLQADYRPVTEAGRNLVRRAAMLSIRIERSAIREAAAISKNVRAAESDFDEARETEVDDLFALLEENPATAFRRLVRMPEGIDRIIDTWLDLRVDLDHGSRWTAEHGVMAARLVGRKPGGFGIARVEALSAAVLGDFSLLGPEGEAAPDPAARREWARSALADLIDAIVEKLEDLRGTIDLEAIAADRAGAGALALFDPSKEATLARKYEAAAEREMHRAIREMKAIEAEAAERGDTLPASPLGSFSPAAPARPMPVAPTPPSSRFEAAEGPGYVPMNIGRADPARI